MDGQGNKLWQVLDGDGQFGSAESWMALRPSVLGDIRVGGERNLGGNGVWLVVQRVALADGKTLWETRRRSQSVLFVRDILPTPDGGAVLTGGTYWDYANNAAWLQRFDGKGARLWTKGFYAGDTVLHALEPAAGGMMTAIGGGRLGGGTTGHDTIAIRFDPGTGKTYCEP